MKINLENNVDIFEKCPRIKTIVESEDGIARLCYFIDLWEYVRNRRQTLCKNPKGACSKGTCIKLGNSSMEFVGCKHLDKNYNFIVDFEMNGKE
jgi:hypothetical protein